MCACSAQVNGNVALDRRKQFLIEFMFVYVNVTMNVRLENSLFAKRY